MFPGAHEAYTNMFFLPARNSLSKEIGSRGPENQPSNFNLTTQTCLILL